MWVPVVHAAVPNRPDEQDTLDSAASVTAALRRLGHTAEIIDIGTRFRTLDRLTDNPLAVVFNLVEAVGGDAGRAHLAIRRMERLGLCYTGAGAAAVELTGSKLGTKRLLAGAGIPTPPWWAGDAVPPADRRVIVKPDTEHASLGIDAGSVVEGGAARAEIARREARFGTRFFAEGFIDGREFNIAMVETAQGVTVLPIPEIIFDLPAGRPHIVDYEAKWDPESHAYHHTPRRFGIERREPALAAELDRIARACWGAAGLSGYARVDLRVDDSGQPMVLEINTNPCIAPDAGLAATAEAAGIGYDDLIALILDAAQLRLRRAA